jgi:hypothetical protein
LLDEAIRSRGVRDRNIINARYWEVAAVVFLRPNPSAVDGSVNRR